MKKFGILLFVLGFVLTSFTLLNPSFSTHSSQNDNTKGIQFKNISFDEALKLAEKEKKLIFIDAYTSWCGPCKLMSKNTFTDEKVGAYFNKNFINLKIDMEKDTDGPNVARRFSVSAYPTFLFVDGKGKLNSRLIGYMAPSDFLIRTQKETKIKG